MLMWFVIYPPLPICYVHMCVCVCVGGGGGGGSCNLDNESLKSTFTVPK